VEKVAYTGTLLRDAVIKYIEDHSPLKIEIQGRWDKDENAKPDPAWIKQFQTSQASVVQ